MTFQDAYKIFRKYGEYLPKQTYINSRTKLTYNCSKCKKEAYISLSNFQKHKRGCKTCKLGKEFLTLKQIDNFPEITDENSGETWKRIEGGWISSFGSAKNLKNKLLKMCLTKYRYRINKKYQYASRLMVKSFEIEGYKKLKSRKYIVSFRDNDNTNFKLENLYVNKK